MLSGAQIEFEALDLQMHQPIGLQHQPCLALALPLLQSQRDQECQ